ncbi:MAG: hypothetical protein Q7U75_02745, partial [Desulfobacterales bacterium]|nr:hypothetical protein [Desulfobacterales bacterium]
WGLISTAGGSDTDYQSASQSSYDTTDADYEAIKKTAAEAAEAWLSMAYANDKASFDAGRKSYLSYVQAGSPLVDAYGRLAFKEPASSVAGTKIASVTWTSFPYWRDSGGGVLVSYAVRTADREFSDSLTLSFSWVKSGETGEWKISGDSTVR